MPSSSDVAHLSAEMRSAATVLRGPHREAEEPTEAIDQAGALRAAALGLHQGRQGRLDGRNDPDAHTP